MSEIKDEEFTVEAPCEGQYTATADESDNARMSADPEGSVIDDEIEQTMKAAGAVILSLEHMRDLILKGEKASDIAALLKVIRPMSMNVETTSSPSVRRIRLMRRDVKSNALRMSFCRRS